MPRQETKFEVNQFTGGLNTDATELTTPEDSSTDELNFDLLKEGTRRRRRGMDLETATVTSLSTDGPTMFVGNQRWEAVAKQPGLNFEVIQTGSTLRFYTASSANLVDGAKAFTVDLNNFKAPAASRTDLQGISVASGKGALFVAGENIRPFYIEYDVDNDTISTTELSLKIRDFDQLDTQDPESGTLTDERKYDLLNQGWYQEDIIIGSSTQIVKITTKSSNPDTSVPGYDGTILDGYIETFGTSPPKTKPWWIGKGTITVDIHIKKPGVFNDTKETREVEAFSKEAFDLYFGGNTVAPLGHYIVNPFYKDRAAASGVTALVAETEKRRPSAVAFYGGRAFYGLGNDIYISQVILDDLGAAERCYQEADPTAEDSIGLIASDGGTITVPDMGNIIRFFTLEGALLVFADNGVWAIYSPQGEGFSITSFAVDFITSVGATGYFNIVDVEGFPYYWSKQGIYRLSPRQDGNIAFSTEEISANKVRNYYADVSPLARQYAKGDYDSTNKVITWLWKSSVSPTIDRFLFDRLLNYSLVFEAFYPYDVAIHAAGDGADKTKGVAGIVRANAFATSTSEINVVNGDTEDSFTSSFYYPFTLATQYADTTGGLADATPAAGGTIVAEPNMPLGSGYLTYNTFTAGVGNRNVTLPSTALLNAGSADWTLEFRLDSDDWIGPAFSEYGVMSLTKSGSIGDPGTLSVPYINVSIINDGFFIQLRGTGGSEHLIDTRPGGPGGNTGTFFSVHQFTSDTGTRYLSFTRFGNNIHFHINGTLIATLDVTGQTFDFSGGGTPLFAFMADSQQGDGAFPGTLGEVRWTPDNRYTSANYTAPSPTSIGGNVVDSSLIQVVVNQTDVTESSIALKYMILQNSQATSLTAELGFGGFNDATSFKDWNTTGFGDDYTSYIETSYYLVEDAMRYIQAPWIYAYIKRTSTTFPAAEGDGSLTSSEFGGPWIGT